MYIAFAQAHLASGLNELNLINILSSTSSTMKKALIFLLVLIAFQAKAQTNPITAINISLPASPNANTINWGVGTSQLTITANAKAVNGRVDGFVQESKILVIIKKNGAKICGAYTNSTAPASNFNTLTKVWSGSNAVSLIGQDCILQPGDYELSVQFFGYSNGKLNPLSDEKTKAFSIRGNEQQSYQAPQVVAPANETILKESDLLKPITFRWTPLIPRPQEPVTYRLRVWQLMEGQNGTQARTVNQPLLTKDVDNLTQAMVSNLITGPCKPPYLCNFVWNIQALNREGKPIGGNNGTSETYSFTYAGVTTVTAIRLKLLSPTNGSTLKVGATTKFSWIINDPGDFTGDGYYKLKIVEVKEGQLPEQAFKTNKPFFEKDSIPCIFNGKRIENDTPPPPPHYGSGKTYAWAIEAFSKNAKPGDGSKYFRIEGHIGKSEVWKFTIEKLDTAKEENASQITLLSPANGSTLTVGEKPNFSWKINVSSVNGPPTKSYKIKIVEILGDQSPEQAFKGNKPIFEKDSANFIRTNKPIFEKDSLTYIFQYQTSVPALKNGKKYAWAVGSSDNWSSSSAFKMSNCDVNLSLKLRSVECLPDVGGNKRYKINLSSTYISSTYNLTYTQIGSGFSAYHLTYSPNYTITNISPTLQTQNSGPSTSVNYSFEVSVPAGQTAIKIGLQGDDKDPGPITCKPGAELDVTLPVCTVPACDCGKWGNLNISTAARPLSYECGSRIVWKCNQALSFSTSYNCSTTDANCQATTSWEILKDGVIIKTGSGANTVADTFTPTSNGVYTIMLSANCGEKHCPPCTYTVVVEDCKSISCDCGEWGDFKVKTVTAAGFVNRAYKCGGSLDWKCNQPFSFSSSYLCSQAVTKCQAKTSWEVRKDGIVIRTGSGTNAAADTFTPTANGIYTITLNAKCGEKECPPCTYTIIIRDCPPPLSCVTPPKGMVAWWTFDESTGSLFADRAGVDNAGTGMSSPLPVTAKVAGGLKFNGNNHVDVPNHAELNFGTGDFSFDAWIQTSQKIGLKDLVDKRSNTKGYLFYLNNGNLGFLIKDGTTTNFNSSLFVADGEWHHIAITVERKNKNGIIFYVDGVPTQVGDPTLQLGNIDNTNKLRIGVDLFSNTHNFSGILDEIELFNRVLTKAEVVSIYQADKAGKCKDVAQGCECGAWGSLQQHNTAGGINYDCGTKKRIVWNCNKPFDFSSIYQCSPNNESCAAKTRWTIKKDDKVIQQGTGTNTLSGSFTPTTNGTYTLILDANCNGKECPSCMYTIVVEDCRPVLSCVVPPAGMVAWWTFDEKAGQPLVDRAGINNAGTGINNPLSMPAKVAGGLKFDGINNYVDVPNHAELNLGIGDFSFDAWIQTDEVKYLSDLVDKRTTKGYLIYLVNGKLGFLLRDESTVNYNSPLFVADGKWHHIAITVARKDKKGIIFYLDGIPTQLGDPTLQPGNIDNTSLLRIGKDLYSDSYNFKGILDEIELFKRVLRPEEVQALYAAGSAGKCKDVIPVCDCGKWGNLNIRSISASYKCGSRIPWKCNQVLSFSNSYQCSTTSTSCITNTSWEIKKGNRVIKSGNGVNNSADTFKPTENGIYTLILKANCGGKECLPCTYTFVVDDCKPNLGCVIPPKNMVAWWPLDEKTGNTATDLSGVNNVGTSNKVLYTPGKVQGAYFFAGNNTSSVQVNDHPELNFGTGDFSFDAWVKADYNNQTQCLVDKQGLNGYSFFLMIGKFGLKMKNGLQTTTYMAPGLVTDGKWHHIAVTVERKKKDGITFYLDGIATKVGDPTLRAGSLDNDRVLRIGGPSSFINNNGFFKGDLDEIELFNRALANEEIVSIFKADRAGKCKPEPEVACTIIRNSGFMLSNQPGIMPSGSVQNWSKAYGSPIVNNDVAEGFIEQGYIKLSGNVSNGQAIMQSLDPNNKIIQGKKYKVSVAVRFKSTENTAGYVRLRAIAFNGSINSNSGAHPLPSADVAIISRSNKIKDCGDWSIVEFPAWVANKDFVNIAFNAFTNDNTNATIWIDNVSVCETTEDVCNEVQVTADGKPITPAGYGNTGSIPSCEAEAEDDEYFHGSLVDLYPGYNGTADLYTQQSNSCFNIGGTLPDDVTNYSCNDSLKLAGIDMTCEELNTLINTDYKPEIKDPPILPPIPPLSDKKCDLTKPSTMGNMPFGGKDIIYIHGLQMSHLIDRAMGVNGTGGKWPTNKNEYYSGYYKTKALENMQPHIDHFLRSRGNLNRYLVVTYDCAESAEVAIHAVLTQIRDAMENGIGVQADRSDRRGTSCFGRDFVMISHSTGALIADVALSIANKTKVQGPLQTKYGDVGLISDRCKGRLSIQGAYSGSNLAKLALVAQGVSAPLFNTALAALLPGISNIQALVSNQGIIANSILVDLVPNITRSRWATYLNDISVPVFTIAGGHPSAILSVLKYSIHPGFDDGVLTMDSSNGNNNPLSFGPSSFSASNNKVFDMGIPLIRAIEYYQDQKISDGVFAAASIANLSPTGMVQPVQSVNVNPQNHFNNHFSFIQSPKEHWIKATETMANNKPYNEPCDYAKTFPGNAVNNEEQLVVANANLFSPSLIDPSIINQMGETVKGLSISYPSIKIVYRRGIPRPSIYWKTFYIWKRTYHNLIDNCMYDVDYGYSYLFKQ